MARPRNQSGEAALLAMTVLLRVKRTRDETSRAPRRTRREASARALPARPHATAAVVVHALGTDPRTLPTQDRALYTCSCGYVFSEDVSTSVACPHCGDSQAW